MRVLKILGLAALAALFLAGKPFTALAQAGDYVDESTGLEGFRIGGNFDGFGIISFTDDIGTNMLLEGQPRAQLFYNELVTACGSRPCDTPVNLANAADGDVDFGLYAARAALYSGTEFNKWSAGAFQITVAAIGGEPLEDNGDPALPGGGTHVVAEGYVDFHLPSKRAGVVLARLQPNVGQNISPSPRGSPFIAVTKSQLLPSFLTGVSPYFKFGDNFTLAGFFYNDLNETNNQDDLDLGFGGAIYYESDWLDVGLTNYISPEYIAGVYGQTAPATGLPTEPDWEQWVYILDLKTEFSLDRTHGLFDVVYRRDGWPTEDIEAAHAFGILFQGFYDVTDFLRAMIGGEYVRSWNTSQFQAGPGTTVPFGVGNIVLDGNIWVAQTSADIRFSKTTGLQLGMNWEMQDPDDAEARWIFSLFGQFYARLEAPMPHSHPGQSEYR